MQKLTLGIENLLKRLDRSQVYRPSNAAPDKPKQAASGKKGEAISQQEVNVSIADVKALVEEAHTKQSLALERIPSWVHGLGGIWVCVVASLLAPNGVGWAACSHVQRRAPGLRPIKAGRARLLLLRHAPGARVDRARRERDDGPESVLLSVRSRRGHIPPVCVVEV